MFIIENGNHWDLSVNQFRYLRAADLIYPCHECRAYHLSDDSVTPDEVDEWLNEIDQSLYVSALVGANKMRREAYERMEFEAASALVLLMIYAEGW